MRYLSPLRYPGGKGRLAPYIAKIVNEQADPITEYAEPFAGGAGAALRLLVDDVVKTIHLNDLNPGIAAMWRAVLLQSDEFCDLIRHHPVTLDSWHEARAVYSAPDGRSDLELGFATFLLNRCNRSGILRARPIGGLEQTGNWKIDARFNRPALEERVRFLAQYRDRINVTQLDGREFLRSFLGREHNILIYVDPPYLVQGEKLYLDSLSIEDHAELAQLLCASELKWFLTYDADIRITQDLYPGLRCMKFNIAHTAQRQHVGSEYAVFSDFLDVPSGSLMNNDDAHWVAW